MDIAELKNQLKDAARQGTEKREENARDRRAHTRESNRALLEKVWPKIMSDIASAVAGGIDRVKVGHASISGLTKAEASSHMKDEIVYHFLEKDSVEHMMCEDLKQAGAQLKFELDEDDRPTLGMTSCTIYIVNPEELTRLA